MATAAHNRLAEAEGLFYSWRLPEAYTILRRYFDRLPFRPEPEHAKYIGIFIRTLLELGKDFELNFYLGELQRQYEKLKEPHLAYQLGMIHLNREQLESARKLFEQLITSPDAAKFHNRARMGLMYIYCSRQPADVASCRQIFSSVAPPADDVERWLLDIWEANILRYEKRYPESEAKLKAVLDAVSADSNWYVHFSAQIILAWLYINRGQMDAARLLVPELKRVFSKRHFRQVEARIEELDKALTQSDGLDPVSLGIGESRNEATLTYLSRSIKLTGATPVDKLLLLLTKNRFVDKEKIVFCLYEREYSGKKDDKLIYSHVHAIRKRLKTIGLPAHAVLSEGKGYRFVPQVKRVRCSS